MKYAVIKFSGTQYFVTEGEEIEVNRLSEKEGQKIEINEVLLLVDGEKVIIGKPLIEKTKVTATVLKTVKKEKIRVAKFKAKTGYRRVTGFRAQKTGLKIEKITP